MSPTLNLCGCDSCCLWGCVALSVSHCVYHLLSHCVTVCHSLSLPHCVCHLLYHLLCLCLTVSLVVWREHLQRRQFAQLVDENKQAKHVDPRCRHHRLNGTHCVMQAYDAAAVTMQVEPARQYCSHSASNSSSSSRVTCRSVALSILELCRTSLPVSSTACLSTGTPIDEANLTCNQRAYVSVC